MLAKAPSSRSHDGYRLTVEPHDKRIQVMFNGVAVADSEHALVMRETRLAPVFYIPRQDVREDLLVRTERRTHCPFKGDASYWNIAVDGRVADNAVWAYEAPFEESRSVKDHYAFYREKVDTWIEDDKEITKGPRPDWEEEPNPLVDWVVKNAWSQNSAADLIADFGRCLVANGVPIWRLRILVRTLHPQLFASGFTWRCDLDEVEEYSPSHEVLQSDAYLQSPFAAIIAGEGGIRRRLDGPDPLLDYPVLHEMKEEGITDYVAMPMQFSDGQINIFTITAKEPGGFSLADLGKVHEVLPLISRLLEIFTLRQSSSTLLGTYLGSRTGQQVLNGLTRRGDGEHIHAAIWFSDLRNSTALTEQLSREEYLEMLNGFFDSMVGPIEARGGEVLKLIGDAVLAIFPIDQQPCNASAACAQAVAAAMDARGNVTRLNEERRSEGKPRIEYGIGLHRGDLTYGNVGAERRLDFTVIGSAVNEASRIEDLCKSLDTWMLTSEEFADSLDGPLQSVGHHALRGVNAEREIFTLQN